MNKFLSFVKTLAIVIVCYVATTYSQIPAGYEIGIDYIDEIDIQAIISYLASDSLKGRPAGYFENDEAAKFIAEKFSSFGLKPYIEPRNPKAKSVDNHEDSDNYSSLLATPKVELTPYDKYFQKFYMLDSKFDKDNSSLSISICKDDVTRSINYDFKKDFIVDYKEGTNLSVCADVVFLGYGIEKGENNYSDYLDANGKPINIKNKIVVMIDGYPQEKDSSSPFNQVKGFIYKSVKKKAETAFEKGAVAVLVAKNPLNGLPPFPVHYSGYANAFSKSDFGLPGLKRKESVPIIYVDDAVVNELFKHTDKSYLNTMQNIDKELKSNSFEVANASVSFKIKYQNELIPVQNVIGYIEGSDPVLKDEYIVIGGHYDHVGLGYYGAMDKKNTGQIHNGADDNASGTAGVIELAEAFSKTKPKRSIIFIAFTAEENGLLGSRYYAYQNPFRSMENTVAMINLDMIGRNENELLWIGGIFYSSEMKDVVEEANKDVGFELLYNVGLLTFGSDQGPFIKKEVPAVFFFAGLHDDYHTPEDDIEKINFSKVKNATKLAYLTGWIIANSDNTPAYRQLSMDEKIVLVKDSLERQKKFRNSDE